MSNAINQEEWIQRCAARFEVRASMGKDEAIRCAEACLENLGGDLTESPEEAADEDLTCWGD